MRDPDLIKLFVAPLEDAGVAYVITGGVATVVYGDPRFTRDVDLVVALRSTGVPGFLSAFDPVDFYVPREETLFEEIGRVAGGHVNVIHKATSLRADIYFAGDDPFNAWALEHRRRIEIEGREASLAPLEYVVVRKLEYYRDSGSDRHLRDVAMMLRVSDALVDPVALREWSARRGVAGLVEEARTFGID